MAISFDKALGIHPQALELRSQRAEILANNIANADTPNYQARDIDFKAVLAGEVQAQQTLPMAQTHSTHNAQVMYPEYGQDLMYKIPTQPAVDGNTVDLDEEMASYGQNSLGYQASFEFLTRKFKGLSNAIKGQ